MAEYRNYVRDMLSNFSAQYKRRRQLESSLGEQPVVESTISPLKVEVSEFYSRDNAKQHHTDPYDIVLDPSPSPVLRRGIPFFYAIRFNRPYDPNNDVVILRLDFGPDPSALKGTSIVLPLTELSCERSKWSARIHQFDGSTITFQVQIPVSAQVGIWKCTVLTKRGNRKEEFHCKEDIYVLFNPWCEEDEVFLHSEELRKEYVLNENGKVWTGSSRIPKSHRWIFGQFDDVVLAAVMYLLELSELKHEDRGKAYCVARAISSIIDGELLVANWDGHYIGGTQPTAWTGTIAIIEKFLKQGGAPVKYGQCWVYSATVVTVCRALGLPCRSITNYVSAHGVSSVNKLLNKEGEEIGGSGECWSFHTWNEVWTARSDLPAGHGGWQALDATPYQENGKAVKRCGPASVEAIRRGLVGFSYDTPYVFSEINAPLNHFQEDESSVTGYIKLQVSNNHVGSRIVTKDAMKEDDEGEADLEDITHLYKTNSPVQTLGFSESLSTETKHEDVHFDLVQTEKVPIGQSFSVTIHIQNKSHSPRTISTVLTAGTVFYNGINAHRLKKVQGEFMVPSGHRETLQMTVVPSEYLDKVVDQGLVKVHAIATVKETKQTWSEEDEFPFNKPRLNIQIRGNAELGQVCQATFSFQNPLPISLTECAFTTEAIGLLRPKMTRHRDVKPGELVTFTETFQPRKTGPRKVVGTFNARQLTEVIGSITVNVGNQ